jgi:hypothetical protein
MLSREYIGRNRHLAYLSAHLAAPGYPAIHAGPRGNDLVVLAWLRPAALADMP